MGSFSDTLFTWRMWYARLLNLLWHGDAQADPGMRYVLLFLPFMPDGSIHPLARARKSRWTLGRGRTSGGMFLGSLVLQTPVAVSPPTRGIPTLEAWAWLRPEHPEDYPVGPDSEFFICIGDLSVRARLYEGRGHHP